MAKGKCDWVPLTPAKESVPARCEINSIDLNQVVSFENPNLSQFCGKSGCEEKESGDYGCEIGNFGCDGANCGEGCCGSVAGKVGFTVRENRGCNSIDVLGLDGKPEGIMVGISDSTKASNEAKNETPRRRNQGKRLKMKRHWPKVFDKTKTKKSLTPKPLKPSTPKPRTPKRPKLVENNSRNKVEPPKGIDRGEAGDSNEMFCKRKLDFDNCATNQNAVSCDEGIHRLERKKSFEQQELPQDNVVSCSESIDNCYSELEDHLLGVEVDLPDLNSYIDILRYRSEQPSDSYVETPSPVESCDEEEDVSASQVYDMFTKALLDFSTQMMAALNIDGRSNQVVLRNPNVELTPFKEKSDPVKKCEPSPKVDLDAETIREFNLVIRNGGNRDTEEEEDAEKAKYWEQERALYESRLDEFIAIMRLLQGERSFSPWKGSVVDSVVGVFLTQNVSDHLSSSAFMTLSARYPPPPVTSEHNDGDGKSDIVIHDNERLRITEPHSDENKQLLMVEKDPSNQIVVDLMNRNINSPQTESTSGRKKGKNQGQQEAVNWDELRKKYSPGISKSRTDRTVDSVNWEAVRQLPVTELAEVILGRGMNNLLAGRIKDFLDLLVRDHGSIDLEWLRDVPPDKAKEYLLSIPGLGLKSVECVRLLELHHPAFPVDVNISRFTTRQGWIPLLPLPEGVQIHDLNQFPDLDSVQQFLWPRIMHISHAKLYEAHCHLILFGKAICTKRQPNCNACPLRANCKHYVSMCASAKPRLEGSHEENMSTESSPASSRESPVKTSPPMLPDLNVDVSGDGSNSWNFEPIIEMPASPVHEHTETDVDVGAQPLPDIEDFLSEGEMPMLKLNGEEFRKSMMSFREGGGYDVSKAVVTLRPDVATLPFPKLKNEERLRTVHHVYELPDSHPLLAAFKKRDPDDPHPYLLAIWMEDKTPNSSQEPKKANNCQELTKCDTCTCSGETVKCQNEQTVEGTILIPCRSANRGSFPLNGTYFQINEVFADHESSQQPIDVPRKWVWDLKRQALYCGTSVHSICKGMSMEEIHHCLAKGFICIRGFDKITRSPKPLARRFHICKTRQLDNEL